MVADFVTSMPDYHLGVTKVIQLSDESYLLDTIKRCKEAASDNKWLQDVKTICNTDSKEYLICKSIVRHLVDNLLLQQITGRQ